MFSVGKIGLKTTVAALLAFGTLAAACGADDTTVTASPESGAEVEMASAVLPTVSGGQIDTGSFEGTDTVLWFWAPW